MNKDPVCPVCESHDWSTLGEMKYRKEQTLQMGPYERPRYRVIFEVWSPNAQEFSIQIVLCRKCGFLCYVPRPTVADLNNKYRFLAEDSESKSELTVKLPSDGIRAREVYELLDGYLSKPNAEILDYGGGNGRLMSAFLEHGHQCNLIDHIEDCLPNINRLGSDIDHIPADLKFDLIICSHVLEHLAKPMEVVRKLVKHLDQDGIIYLEVPLEIWDGLPHLTEPVTHINFFCRRSMEILVYLAGLTPIVCREDTYTTEQGNKAFAIKVVARLADVKVDTEKLFVGAENDARATIYPSVVQKFTKMLKYSRYRARKINELGRKYLPRTFFWRFFN